MATLPVKVNFINAPRGFDNSVLSYALSCKQLKVAGPAEKIDALSTLSIGTIDLSTFSLNKVYEMPIELPTDIYLLDNISTITVSFDCSGLETKTMNLPSSCVQVVNQPARYLSADGGDRAADERDPLRPQGRYGDLDPRAGGH